MFKSACLLHPNCRLFSTWLDQRLLDAIDYLREEVRVLRGQLGPRRLRFTDSQRRRLARKGKRLGRRILRGLATIAAPETILAWHRKLIERRFPEPLQRPRGRPRTKKQIEDLINLMASENLS